MMLIAFARISRLRRLPWPCSAKGSAYMITLLVLVVLTMLALALTFTTQTELLVGTNERILQRVFYAADSGVHLAVARTLNSHDKCLYGDTFEDVPAGKPGSLLKAFIEHDYIYPVAAPWCNFCEVNNVDEYSSRALLKVNHQITASSRLYASETVAARKTMTAMIDVQPWRDAIPPMEKTCGRQRWEHLHKKNTEGLQ